MSKPKTDTVTERPIPAAALAELRALYAQYTNALRLVLLGMDLPAGCAVNLDLEAGVIHVSPPPEGASSG